MSYGLNSLKGGYIGEYIGDYNIGGIEGDTRSLDYGSYECEKAACGYSRGTGSIGLDKENWLNPEPRFLSNSFMIRV